MRRMRVGCFAAAVRIAEAALAKLRGVTRPSTRSGPMTPSALPIAPNDTPPFAPSARTATWGSVPFALRAASMPTPVAEPAAAVGVGLEAEAAQHGRGEDHRGVADHQRRAAADAPPCDACTLAPASHA